MGSVATINAKHTQRPGEVLLQAGLASDALPYLLSSAESEPSEWRHPLNLAIAYRFLGRMDDAYQSLRVACRLCPEAWPVYHTWGNLMDDLGKFREALDLRWKAWELCKGTRQEVALAIGISLLRKGEWQRAWPFWEMGRFTYSWSPPPGVRVWQREPLEGKRLLVLSEGGYGDVFQFSRWLPLLIRQGASVTMSVWERQIDILRHSEEMAGVHFISIDKDLEMRNFDFATSILSFPSILNAIPKTVPPPVNFNVSAMLEPTQARRIGICWQAEENGSHRKVRSVPLGNIETFKTVDAEWYSLVPGQSLPWMKLGPDNWLDTARLIESLDAVVTVDTAVAHLAGCMGKNVIMMLPTCAEWRWGLGSSGEPWYGNIKLVRSEKYDEWGGVVAECVGLLDGR